MADDTCRCGHSRLEHLEDESEYFECTHYGCECEDYRPATSDDAATAEEEGE